MQPEILDSQHLHDLLSNSALLVPRVHDLENKAKALHEDVNHCHTALQEGLKTSRQAFDAVKEKIAGLESLVSDRQKQIAGEIGPLAADLNETRDKLQSQAQQLQDAIETSSKSVEGVATAVEARTKELEGRRQAVEEALSTLEHTVEQHETALNEAVQHAQTEAQSLTQRAEHGEQEMSQLLSDLKTRIDHAVQQVAQHDNDHLHDVQTASTNHQADLEHLAQAVADHTSSSNSTPSREPEQISEEIMKVISDFVHVIDDTQQIFKQSTALTKELEQSTKPIIDKFKELVDQVHSLAGPVESALHQAEQQAAVH